MSAGRAGAVTALLVYSLLLNFLSPANNILLMKPVDMKQFSTVYGNADFLSQQTNQAIGNFGFGKHVLATTIVYPSLYLRLKKHFKPPTQLRQSDALLITICLLLSGDIHPCPGPLHSEPVNQNNITADVTCHTTLSQVSTLCSDTLPFDQVQQTNQVQQTTFPRRLLLLGVRCLPGVSGPAWLGCARPGPVVRDCPLWKRACVLAC